MSKYRELNIRDIGGGRSTYGALCYAKNVPKGLFIRSGKLSILTPDECTGLCNRYNIKCVIDLRTPVESAEFPDPLPEGVEYMQIPLLKDAAVGITHETGSLQSKAAKPSADPMAIIKNLRKNPEKLRAMIPDFKALYTDIVTDEYCRSQLDKVVSTLRENADNGICTLYHCTAGKDRTGIVSMVFMKSYGVRDDAIIKDYMRTNRNAFWPTMRKCLGVGLLTWNWNLVKTAYKSFMADRELIETAITNYKQR